MASPEVLDDGSVRVRGGLLVPSSEIVIRRTTSGGPGGQHANRTESRVIATWSIALSNSLSPRQRSLLEKNLGRSVSSSSSTHRSQAANRQAALGRLALRIDGALYVTPPRRVTKPTKGSQKRRVDEKKRRSVTKVTRRRPVGED